MPSPMVWQYDTPLKRKFDSLVESPCERAVVMPGAFPSDSPLPLPSLPSASGLLVLFLRRCFVGASHVAGTAKRRAVEVCVPARRASPPRRLVMSPPRMTSAAVELSAASFLDQPAGSSTERLAAAHRRTFALAALATPVVPSPPSPAPRPVIPNPTGTFRVPDSSDDEESPSLPLPRARRVGFHECPASGHPYVQRRKYVPGETMEQTWSSPVMETPSPLAQHLAATRSLTFEQRLSTPVQSILKRRQELLSTPLAGVPWTLPFFRSSPLEVSDDDDDDNGGYFMTGALPCPSDDDDDEGYFMTGALPWPADDIVSPDVHGAAVSDVASSPPLEDFVDSDISMPDASPLAPNDIVSSELHHASVPSGAIDELFTTDSSRGSPSMRLPSTSILGASNVHLHVVDSLRDSPSQQLPSTSVSGASNVQLPTVDSLRDSSSQQSSSASRPGASNVQLPTIEIDSPPDSHLQQLPSTSVSSASNVQLPTVDSPRDSPSQQLPSTSILGAWNVELPTIEVHSPRDSPLQQLPSTAILGTSNDGLPSSHSSSDSPSKQLLSPSLPGSSDDGLPTLDSPSRQLLSASLPGSSNDGLPTLDSPSKQLLSPSLPGSSDDGLPTLDSPSRQLLSALLPRASNLGLPTIHSHSDSPSKQLLSELALAREVNERRQRESVRDTMVFNGHASANDTSQLEQTEVTGMVQTPPVPSPAKPERLRRRQQKAKQASDQTAGKARRQSTERDSNDVDEVDASLQQLRVSTKARSARSKKAEKPFKDPERTTPTERVIQPLSEEWDHKVTVAMSATSPAAELAKAKDGTPLRRKDFGTILPGVNDRADGWLNDEVVNAYLQAVVEFGQQKSCNARGTQRRGPPYCHAFNTFFYKKLKEQGPQAVQSWPRRFKFAGQDLLKVNTIFIPVHEHSHWTLLVVSPECRTIEYFDSMNGRKDVFVRNVKAFLRHQLGSSYVDSEWRVLDSRSPQQMNGKDCGVFVATTAKMIIQGIDPMAYSQEDIPTQRRRMVAELINGGFNGDFAI